MQVTVFGKANLFHSSQLLQATSLQGRLLVKEIESLVQNRNPLTRCLTLFEHALYYKNVERETCQLIKTVLTSEISPHNPLFIINRQVFASYLTLSFSAFSLPLTLLFSLF